MAEDFDTRLRRALRDRAGQVRGGGDVFDEIRRRSARRRRRQHRAVSVAMIVALAVPAVAALPRLLPDGTQEQEVVLGGGSTLEVEAPPPDQTVAVPPPGEARGATLDNGTPVLVVHDGKRVHVFDARSPHSQDGRRGQLGWCGELSYTGGLLDPVTNRRWTAGGSPVVAQVEKGHEGAFGASEPPRQLVAYAVRGEPSDGVVRVGQPAPMGVSTTPTNAESFPPAPRPCSTREVVTPPLRGERVDVGELGELPDGDYRVAATLEQVGQDQPRLCAIPDDVNHLRALHRPPRPAHLQPPLCDEATTETVDAPGRGVVDLSGDPHLAHVRAGQFGVSVRNGEVRKLRIPASSMPPRSVPVAGEVVLDGSLRPPGPDRGGGPPSDRSFNRGPSAGDSGVDYAPSPPDHPVALPSPLVDRGQGDAEESVALATDKVVDGPDWFDLDSPHAPDWNQPEFHVPLAADVDISIRGQSLQPDDFVDRVDSGELEGHEVTVTVDRASGRGVEIRSPEGQGTG